MTKMEMHDVISKLEFIRNGYQKLIDENVDCGTIVGTDITGTWKAETPLNDVYKQHVEALDTAIKVLSAQPEQEIIHCRDCKHYELKRVLLIQDLTVIRREICHAWGEGCKTDQDGFCFLAERKEDDHSE